MHCFISAKIDRFLLSLSYIFLGMLRTTNLIRCLESQLMCENNNNLRNIKLLGDWRAKQKEEKFLGRDRHRRKDIICRGLQQITLAYVCIFMLFPTENVKGIFYSSAK